MWWWGHTAHAEFLTYPNGSIDDVGDLDPTAYYEGVQDANQPVAATYSSTGWLPVPRKLLSPDGSSYVYWDWDRSGSEIITVASASSRARSTVYRGPGLYLPIAFAADGIYLVKAWPMLAMGQNLYRLNVGGGVPQLVSGSDRHMNTAPGWTLIADGAAWGIDSTTVGDDSTSVRASVYSIVRLDLSTSQATTWFTAPPNIMPLPIGVDARHRLVAVTGTKVWSIATPGATLELPDRSWVQTVIGWDIDSGFASGPEGMWLPGMGGVWLYAEGKSPQFFAAGPTDRPSYPAGTCLS